MSWYNERKRHSLAARGIKTAVNNPKEKAMMKEKYYEDEEGILRGICPRHGEFVGDAIGCPECFREYEELEAMIEPFEYQDKNQERLIHSPYWHRGNSYRFVLEGAGDIFRELSLKSPNFYYIEEKLRRIENHIEDYENPPKWTDEEDKYFKRTTGVSPKKTRIHPEDSYEYSYKHNKPIFEKMKKLWEKQPYNTEKQKAAIELNIAMLEKDYDKAKKEIAKIRE